MIETSVTSLIPLQSEKANRSAGCAAMNAISARFRLDSTSGAISA
jgi:hypothetical protein